MTQQHSSVPLIRIVDDDEGVRMSSAFLLGAVGYRTICYESAGEFLDRDDPLVPGCVLLDVRMPGMTGLELQDEMEKRGSKLPLIFITGHGDVDMAVHVLKQGAVDFLQKPLDSNQLISVVASAVEKDLARAKSEEDIREAREAYEDLTAREKEVVQLVAEGLQNKEIASRLNIAEKTVKVHRGSATRKLNVRNGVDIAALLRKIGL